MLTRVIGRNLVKQAITLNAITPLIQLHKHVCINQFASKNVVKPKQETDESYPRLYDQDPDYTPAGGNQPKGEFSTYTLDACIKWIQHHSDKFRSSNTGQVEEYIEPYNKNIDLDKDIDEQSAITLYKSIYPLRYNEDEMTPTKILTNYIPKLDYNSNNINTIISTYIEFNCVIITNTPSLESLMYDKFNEGPMITIYGGTFEVKNDSSKAINIAYTNKNLLLHQDLVQYNPPPYIQLLYCKYNSINGGESLLQSIYLLALEFKAKYPESFEIMSKNKFAFHKIHYKREKPVYLINHKYVFELDYNGKLLRVNWSPPFEGYNYKENFNIIYPHYCKFKKFLEESPKISFKLADNETVIFNNVNTLHGREQFNQNEKRLLNGCYYSEEQWKNIYYVNKYKDHYLNSKL